jgi:hypothetical protein
MILVTLRDGTGRCIANRPASPQPRHVEASRIATIHTEVVACGLAPERKAPEIWETSCPVEIG